MPTLNVHHLPEHVEPARLAGSTVVVIDLLRASSTICQALAAGATCVVPYLEVDDARRAADTIGREAVVLGGERHGKVIDGFDLGNSPLEYTAEAMRGRRLLFTTTNGTRALHHARHAGRTLIGCALNRQAVASAAADAARIDIVCAGTNGAVTDEDILAAGAIVHALLDPDVSADSATMLHYKTSESARDAAARWRLLLEAARRGRLSPASQLAEVMRDTAGGRNLLDIGHDADLTACAQLDVLEIVPELNRSTGEIRPA